MSFKSIREFKDCIIRGGEPVFAWKGVCYGVCFHGEGYCIAREDGSGEKLCKTPDEVLEYIVSGDRLRDVIHASYCSGTLTFERRKKFRG